jgi:hypothetical protein
MHSRKLISVTISSLVLAMLVSLATCVIAGTQSASIGIGIPGRQSQAGNIQEVFTPDERARLSDKALAHLKGSLRVKEQRLRVLGVKRLPSEKGADQKSIASVVVFNYSQGTATRLILDSSDGTVLREERLRGRPQASEEELEEARQIIRADPEHARLLEAGGVLEGGFVVDDPARRSTSGRFIQFQILTSDRQGLQRFVTVNLTTGRIAESRQR